MKIAYVPVSKALQQIYPNGVSQARMAVVAQEISQKYPELNKQPLLVRMMMAHTKRVGKNIFGIGKNAEKNLLNRR